MDDKRTFWIIGTWITGMLCGCPGLCILLFRVKSFGENLTAGSGATGYVADLILCCLGLFMTAIPVVIAFYTFRRKRTEFDSNEPIPPAI